MYLLKDLGIKIKLCLFIFSEAISAISVIDNAVDFNKFGPGCAYHFDVGVL